MKTTFTGFSTVSSDKKRDYKLYDINLIKQDLLNHFHTRIGERVMRPEYGCRIWDYLMEPFTAAIRDMTIQEVTRICNSDSRVELVQVHATGYDQGLRVEAVLNYIPFDTTGTFMVEFENRQGKQGF